MQVEGRSNGKRRGSGIALVVLALVLLQLAGLGRAGASPDDARAAFIAALNRSRAELRNAPPLRPAPDLDAVALRHAAAMADRGSIFHNPDLGRQVERWESVGENVGVGSDVATLHQAFLDSPAHRTNLLDDRYLEVGIGIVERGGHLWVVEIFRRALPAGAVVTSDPAPAPVVPDAAALAATAAMAPAATAPETATSRVARAPLAAAEPSGDRPGRTSSLLPLAWAVLTVGVLLAAVSGLDRSGATVRPRRPVTA